MFTVKLSTVLIVYPHLPTLFAIGVNNDGHFIDEEN